MYWNMNLVRTEQLLVWSFIINTLTGCIFWWWIHQVTQTNKQKVEKNTYSVSGRLNKVKVYSFWHEYFSTIWKVRTYEQNVPLCVTTNDHVNHCILSIFFVNENVFGVRVKLKQSSFFPLITFSRKENKKEKLSLEKIAYVRTEHSIYFSLEKLKIKTYAFTKG